MFGEPRYHKVIGASEKAVEHGFFPTCGSQVPMKLGHLPEVRGSPAASLLDPSIYRPTMDVFTSSAQPWDHMDPDTTKHTHGPPM